MTEERNEHAPTTPPADGGREDRPGAGGEPGAGGREESTAGSADEALGGKRGRERRGRRGRATRPRHPKRPCLNCGDPTPGEYCASCGQRKVDVKVSVRLLVMDVMEDQFLLDKRLPRTLGALLFQPGHLTVE